MSRICEVSGKGPLTGNRVSHAKNRTKHVFLPNLRKKRFYSEEQKRWVTLRVSSHGMRTIDKLGLDHVLKEMEADKLKAVKLKADKFKD